MATRIAPPTEEELAEHESRILRRQQEQEFEESRRKLENLRPKGAAKLSRTRAFRVTEPPRSRGPMDLEPEEPGPAAEETPADVLRRANAGKPPVSTNGKPKRKGRYDVPEVRNASTILKAMGVIYVEERKKDPITAYQNLRDSIMLNLDVLIPAMPQIKQMFELLQIGEPTKQDKGGGSKEDALSKQVRGLQNFLTGEDAEDE